jgi:hypothetical protein
MMAGDCAYAGDRYPEKILQLHRMASPLLGQGPSTRGCAAVSPPWPMLASICDTRHLSRTLAATTFIADLPSLTRFSDLADPAHFVPAPDDWRLYCCDIVNSTGAIAAGRYKAVNMAGAACIMAAVNSAPGVDLAYVFGGDGATILAPDALARAIDRVLSQTRRLAREGFGLAMRVGAVPVLELRARGADLAVAMLELSPGNRLAMFSGGGAALADRLIKGDERGAWRLADADDSDPNLTGLSCRWEGLAARHGAMAWPPGRGPAGRPGLSGADLRRSDRCDRADPGRRHRCRRARTG